MTIETASSSSGSGEPNPVPDNIEQVKKLTHEGFLQCLKQNGKELAKNEELFNAAIKHFISDDAVAIELVLNYMDHIEPRFWQDNWPYLVKAYAEIGQEVFSEQALETFRKADITAQLAALSKALQPLIERRDQAQQWKDSLLAPLYESWIPTLAPAFYPNYEGTDASMLLRFSAAALSALVFFSTLILRIMPSAVAGLIACYQLRLNYLIKQEMKDIPDAPEGLSDKIAKFSQSTDLDSALSVLDHGLTFEEKLSEEKSASTGAAGFFGRSSSKEASKTTGSFPPLELDPEDEVDDDSEDEGYEGDEDPTTNNTPP